MSIARRRHGSVALAALALAGLVASTTAQGADVSQIKVGVLSGNTSTTTANNYYTAHPGINTFTREFWGPDPAANRPVELKELARALRNDVDLIYEHVHDNVRTVFMYGLQKGALGAVIDQSGTPFDQAHLMVELLREAGYSARIKAGTVTLSTSQANNWIGTSNTTALQKILRDGGIPLNFSSGTFTIAHAWVEVTIPGATCGSTCWFDPSYKTHTFKAPLSNLESLMGWNATNEFSTTTGSGFLMQSWSGIQQQPVPADPVWVSLINYANMQTKLQSYSSTLLTNLKSATHKDKEIDDVVGGQDIIKAGSAEVRNSGTLPGFTPIAVQRTWDCTSTPTCGVPDAYRTRLIVSMLDQNLPDTNPPLITKTLFADEVYGRRVYFDTPEALSQPDDGGGIWTSLEPWCIRLKVDSVAVAGASTGCGGQLTPEPWIRDHQVRIEVDHPYAAGTPAGSHMDMSVAQNTHTQKRADFVVPVVIIHGWGDVSPALVSKISPEQNADNLLPVYDPPGTMEPGSQRGDSANDHTMQKLSASFLAQYTRMAEIQKRLGNSEHVMHHLVGIAYAESTATSGWTFPANQQTAHDWYIADRAIRINVDGAISVNSKANVAAERQKVIHSTLAAAALLEGSIFEQMLDSFSAGSTASRFQWGNANLGASLKFYLHVPSGSPGGGQVPTYANQGFWTIDADNNALGPGNATGAMIPGQGYEPTMQRGGAFIAFKPNHSAVAHVTTYGPGGEFKGGGAGVPPEYDRTFDAAGAASLLKDKFEDRSRLHGVDLQSGDLSYSAPPDIRLGEGGFPYELSFQRSFKASASKSHGMLDGWAHNLDIRASISGDGLAMMGQESAWTAAETIAAIYTMQKIYSVAPAPASGATPTQLRDHLKRWVLAPFVMNWWGAKLNNNVVTINSGHSARQFTLMADGTFYPGRTGVGTLTRTGTRTLHQSPNLPPGNHDRWSYSGVSLSYTSPEKDVQTFTYFEYENAYNPQVSGTPESEIGRKHGWKLTSWSFPSGVTLTYSYFASGDTLSSVSNNLGRTLTLNYTNNTMTTVTDGQSRSVQFLYTSTIPGGGHRVVSPENETTHYSYIGGVWNPGLVPAGARPQVYPKLRAVYAPSDSTFAKVELVYDRTWRVKEYKDAVAIKTPAQRTPWNFYITGTNRGERHDPAGGEYLVYYDNRGRAIQFHERVDTSTHRVVNQIYDNRDRVKERTLPEGNKVAFAYHDATHQITSLTQKRKSSTYWSPTSADIVIAATYDATCGKIKTVTDALLKVTTWNYNATTCTLTNIQQPQVPDPANGNVMTTPVTSFLYNGFGQLTQVTDPTNRIAAIEYDATTKYRLRQRVDPSGMNLTTTYGHNNYGDISLVTNPRNFSTSYVYDKQRRLTVINAPLAATTINRIDADGDVYQVERSMDAAQTQWQIWSKTFTPTKKVLTETAPAGPTGSAVTTYSYDGADRVDVVTDPAGRKVKTDYFYDGKPKRIIKAYQSATMPEINYAIYALTPNGQIDTVTDANGNVTNLDYEGFDRLHRTFFAHATSGAVCAPSLPHTDVLPTCGAGQTFEQLTYDANGSVRFKRNRSGGSIEFIFDNINRETTRNVPNNTLGHFARTLTTRYDLASRKWDVVADGQTILQGYDAAGRVDWVTDSYLGGTNLIDYGYDTAGNRTSMTWPGGGSLSYAFDALNRMDTVTDVGTGIQLGDYTWDTLSRRDLSAFNGSAFSADYGYENDDDLNSLVHSGPAPLAFTIGRNLASQINSLLVSDGAFLATPAVTQTDTYTPNKLNQIASLNATTLSYDANGNLTSDGTYTFEYDEENRLRSAVGGGFTTSYEYDPLGRRRAKIVDGVTTKYASDGAEEIEERDGSNAVLRRYAYGPSIDDRIAIFDTTYCPATPSTQSWCFYLTNWQGSATTMVKRDGSLREVYHYGPYGEGVNWTPQDALTGNPFRYTGRRVDPETGLYYYRARYYTPKLGRFLQTDPIGTRDDLNLYAYAGSDPLNASDPTGTESCGSRTSYDAAQCRSYGSVEGQGSVEGEATGPRSRPGTPDDGENFSPKKKGWHDYTVTNEVCSAGQACTEEEVREQLSRHAYPGQDPNNPVRDEGRYLVVDEVTKLPGGYVTTRVSKDGLTVVNTTTPLHILYNGRIVRSAFQSDGAWFVRTHGVGNNVVPGMAKANQYWGPVQFNSLDRRMREVLDKLR